MHRRRLLAGVAVPVCLTLAGCAAAGGVAGAGPGTTPHRGGTVNVLAGTDFSHLDPAAGWDGGVNNFYRLIYRTLTTYGTGRNATTVVPDLATSLGTPSDGGRTWTYHLKKGLRFATGAPITSRDVKFGAERAWDPDVGIGSPYAKQLIAAPKDYRGPYLSGDLDTIDTPDPRTIVFHLVKPFPEFPSALAQPTITPFPPGTGAKHAFDTRPISSGPYRVVEYQRGAELRLARNRYWKRSTDPVRTAYPDSYVWHFGIDAATLDERMLADQGADANAVAGTIQASSVARIQDPRIKHRTLSGPTGCTTYLSLNTTKKPLDDVRVRRAVNEAVDKTSIVAAFGGHRLAQEATSVEPPTTPGRQAYDLYPYRPNAARTLLAEAGLRHGFTMTLDARADPKQRDTAVAIQAALQKIGITVKINTIDSATFYEVTGTPSQQHDAALTGWCPDWQGGRTFLTPLFDGRQIYPKGNQNLAQLNDPRINRRLDEIGAMTDVDAANERYGELDEQIMRQAPIVPLVYEKYIFVVGSNMAGVHLSPSFSGGIDFVTLGLQDPKK